VYHNSSRNKIFSNSSGNIFFPLTQLTSLQQGDCSAAEVKTSPTAYPLTSDLKTLWKSNTAYPFILQPFSSHFSHRPCKKKVFIKNIHFPWLWYTDHVENTTVVAKCDFLWE
jgi:hypothetical protein